jgi:hypothetical protein
MYQMVRDIVQEYQPVWENTPKFVSSYDAFNAKFEALKIQAEKQRTYAISVRATRDDFRKETAQLAIRVASALTAYGEEQKDLQLIMLMKISEFQLMNRSHSDTLILLDRILIHAQMHETELVEFGITPTTLASFISHRDQLAVTILAPRKAIVNRKDSSAKIVELTNEIDKLLKNGLDKMVTILRPESEEFHRKYFDSRMVLSVGSSGTSGNELGTDPNAY